MKYIISATHPGYDESPNHLHESKPCKNAEEMEYNHFFDRKIKDENGKYIKETRCVKLKCWTVDLNSLEDVHKLMGELNEPLIFFNELHETGLPEIEIYNGYRE